MGFIGFIGFTGFIGFIGFIGFRVKFAEFREQVLVLRIPVFFNSRVQVS